MSQIGPTPELPWKYCNACQRKRQTLGVERRAKKYRNAVSQGTQEKGGEKVPCPEPASLIYPFHPLSSNNDPIDIISPISIGNNYSIITHRQKIFPKFPYDTAQILMGVNLVIVEDKILHYPRGLPG